MLATNRQLFLSHVAQTSFTPLLAEVERAEGIYMYRPDGSRIIDVVSGVSVSNVGHRHPQVVTFLLLHLLAFGV